MNKSGQVDCSPTDQQVTFQFRDYNIRHSPRILIFDLNSIKLKEEKKPIC